MGNKGYYKDLIIFGHPYPTTFVLSCANGPLATPTTDAPTDDVSGANAPVGYLLMIIVMKM